MSNNINKRHTLKDLKAGGSSQKLLLMPANTRSDNRDKTLVSARNNYIPNATIHTAQLIEGDFGVASGGAGGSQVPKMVQGGIAREHMRRTSIISLVRSGVSPNPEYMKS